MKKYLIVTAMPEELAPVIKEYKTEKIEISHTNYPIYKYVENNQEFIFAATGIGKVNAAYSIELLINHFAPDFVFSLGTAGGVNSKLAIGDLVIGNKLAYHDVDVTSFGHEIGQIPNQEIYYLTYQSDKLEEEMTKNGITHYSGTILSGDQFIDNKEKVFELEKTFDNVYAIEMESCAIVDVCNKRNIPVIVIRGISDLAHGQSTVEFDEYLHKVMQKFSKIVKILIDYGI